MSDDELFAWVFDVDRRVILMESMKRHSVLKASFIAQETSRSIQNISHALKEFREKGFITCLNPEKTTWKKYIVNENGKLLLKRLDNFCN
ncbi:sugar-specific transcriptional regulator TrmB [Methanolobus sp. WCC4]|uniref:sugar-specific transcriptional regulator TrmB n=1 Tax=Methanolobus sp. WCC4 TaxID=3125784 RepID=UPI0030F74BC0